MFSVAGLEVPVEDSTCNDDLEIVWKKVLWDEIKPTLKVHEKSGRQGMVLGPNYTDLLCDALWVEHKIQCCFKILRSTITKDYEDTDRPYIQIDGICKECGASLMVCMETEELLEDGSMLSRVTINNRKV